MSSHPQCLLSNDTFMNIPQENDAMTTHSATHQGLERILSISALLRRLVRAIARSLAINPK